jgi:hypothetical protein
MLLGRRQEIQQFVFHPERLERESVFRPTDDPTLVLAAGGQRDPALDFQARYLACGSKG